MDFSRPDNARKINRLKVLGALRKEDLSRAELSRELLINKVSISEITDSLLKDGLIESAAIDNATSGRPATKLTIAKKKGRVFSFLFTKNTVTASAANLLGQVLRFERFPYDENTVSTIASFINKMTTDDPNIFGVSIITEDQSQIPSDAFPWPVVYTTKAEAQARAELEADSSLEKCLFISWSDSIEAAYEDKFLHSIPTFGHMKVTKGIKCTCGGIGCLNAVASGIVLKERTGFTQYRKLLTEEKGILAIDDCGKGMTFAIAEAVQAIGAEKVMFTGELSGMSEDLYASMNDELKMSLPPSRSELKIQKSQKGDNGLLEGASLIALDEFFYHKEILRQLEEIQVKANF